MDKTILEINSLSKSYMQGREKICVLDNLDFSISRGEFVSIVGPSGSGKSTLLNIIGLLDNVYDGSMKLFSKNMESIEEKHKAELRLKHLGFVFQFDSLLPEFTVLENIEMPACILGLSQGASAAELLKRFDLEEISSKFPMEISGGEKQRSAIMRALRNAPELLIADEPTGNLDPANSDMIMEDMRRTADSGTAVLMVTHNEKAAFEADRVLRMNHGKLEEVKRPDTLS